MPSGKTTIFRKFRKNRKNGHFLQSLTLKMVGLLQLKLPTSTLVGFLMQYIRNFELTFRSRRNSVFYFLAETGEKLHRRTEWSEYFSKQAKNQFFCSRPRVTGLLNICTRLLYPIKPKTAFEIIRRQIVQFAMKTHKVVKVHTIEIQSENFSR